MSRIQGVFGLDHVVLLVPAHPVLRAEGSRDIQLAEVHQGIQTMPTFGRTGRRVAEQCQTATLKGSAQPFVFQ